MPKRVLIIDDDKDVIDVLEEIFTYSNYQVYHSTDARRLFPLIEEVQPDVLILDCSLKKEITMEICRKLKTNPSTRTLPIIVISAYPDFSRNMTNDYCDLFISKPFDLNTITRKATELIAFKIFRSVNF